MVLLRSKLFRETLRKTVESKCQTVILGFKAPKSLGTTSSLSLSCLLHIKNSNNSTHFLNKYFWTHPASRDFTYGTYALYREKAQPLFQEMKDKANGDTRGSARRVFWTLLFAVTFVSYVVNSRSSRI